MATLEKIRSKSALLFSIIIVALLAFILGDFLTNGRTLMGTGDTVAEANGAKVDFKTYQERLSQRSEAEKNQGRQTDPDQLSQQVIDELLVEALLKQEYDRMGITVTDKQLSDLMLGQQTGQAVFQTLMQQFGQSAAALYQKGIVDVRNYYDAMRNPKKYGLQPEESKMLESVWAQTEKNIDQSLRSQAYGALIQGLFTANEVDAKALYNDRNTTTSFAYVAKDLNSVADKDVKLEDEDYKAVYNRYKGNFKLTEEQRSVSYIAVPIAPSEADFAKGQQDVNAVVAQLSSTEGTQALTSHPEFASQVVKYTRAALSQDAAVRSLLTDSAATLAAGTVRPTMNVGGNYAIAKVLGVSTGVDKVKFSAVAGLQSDIDSLRSKLTVANFDSIARANGGMAAMETSLINPKFALNEKMLKALENQPVGQIFVLSDTVSAPGEDGKAKQQIGATAFLITERDAAVPVYEIAKITYQVLPSQATIADLNSKFRAYVANNANAEAFAKNAEKSGYSASTALVSASTPSVGGAPGSRSVVKWAMENGKGKVSNVFTRNSNGSEYLIAVAVNDIYDGDYLPYDAKFVKDMLKPMAMADKKAEKLIKQFSGKAKDINGYAAAMGVAAQQGQSVFGEDQVPGLGFDQAVQGVVAASAKGKVSAPFKGANAVYVISVSDSKTQGRPYNFQENAATFGQKVVAPMMQNPLQLLVGDGKVKNNILQFTAGE